MFQSLVYPSGDKHWVDEKIVTITLLLRPVLSLSLFLVETNEDLNRGCRLRKQDCIDVHTCKIYDIAIMLMRTFPLIAETIEPEVARNRLASRSTIRIDEVNEGKSFDAD